MRYDPNAPAPVIGAAAPTHGFASTDFDPIPVGEARALGATKTDVTVATDAARRSGRGSGPIPDTILQFLVTGVLKAVLAVLTRFGSRGKAPRTLAKAEKLLAKAARFLAVLAGYETTAVVRGAEGTGTMTLDVARLRKTQVEAECETFEKAGHGHLLKRTPGFLRFLPWVILIPDGILISYTYASSANALGSTPQFLLAAMPVFLGILATFFSAWWAGRQENARREFDARGQRIHAAKARTRRTVFLTVSLVLAGALGYLIAARVVEQTTIGGTADIGTLIVKALLGFAAALVPAILGYLVEANDGTSASRYADSLRTQIAKHDRTQARLADAVIALCVKAVAALDAYTKARAAVIAKARRTLQAAHVRSVLFATMTGHDALAKATVDPGSLTSGIEHVEPDWSVIKVLDERVKAVRADAEQLGGDAQRLRPVLGDTPARTEQNADEPEPAAAG